MPTTLASLVTLVHPHQLEVQDFDHYALVIDARSPAEYAEDHLPRAVLLPARMAAASIDPLSPLVAGLDAHAAILVYCGRGGLDSETWASPLRRLGFEVDVLAGGWSNYRRWVDAGLESLPRCLTFMRLVGPPVGGLCRFLRALRRRGEQVLDVTTLAGQRLVPGLNLACDRSPSQHAFDSALLDALRRCDPERPVWVRCTQLPPNLVVPAAFAEAMRKARSVRIEAPVSERARLWRHKLRVAHTPVTEVIEALQPGRVTGQVAGVVAHGTDDILASLIEDRIDPLGLATLGAEPTEVVHVASLNTGAVTAVVAHWLATPKAGLASAAGR
jgi:tRNA 2-selenouridine synthase